MLTPEDHAKLLRSFEVDRLLKLVTLEAKRFHDGHYAIFAFREHYKVAFGTPSLYPDRSGGSSHAQVNAMPGFSTLKEALIAALVAGKDFGTTLMGMQRPGGRHGCVQHGQNRFRPDPSPEPAAWRWEQRPGGPRRWQPRLHTEEAVCRRHVF